MRLNETGPVPLPASTDALRDHLRLPADPGEEALLTRYLAAATAQVEGRTGLALVARAFSLRVAAWDDGCLTLPKGPVDAIDALTLFAADATTTAIDPATLALEPGLVRQTLSGRGGALPPIPTGGQAEIAFTAGFGPGPADVPPDLVQAVLLLAARAYEARVPCGVEAGLPADVARLLSRWLPLRLKLGRRALA